jgi:hypothetical protein
MASRVRRIFVVEFRYAAAVSFKKFILQAESSVIGSRSDAMYVEILHIHHSDICYQPSKFFPGFLRRDV